jgi:SAM-dependent methyltransferase
MTATDISYNAIEEAKQEARRRGLYVDDELIGKSRIKFPGTFDIRNIANDISHSEGFDVVLACDNVIPHLPTPTAILEAFRQVRACLVRRSVLQYVVPSPSPFSHPPSPSPFSLLPSLFSLLSSPFTLLTSLLLTSHLQPEQSKRRTKVSSF